MPALLGDRHLVNPDVGDPGDLAMYAAGTFQMAHAMQLDFLLILPRIFVYVALGAWALTFAGLCRRLGYHLMWSIDRGPRSFIRGHNEGV